MATDPTTSNPAPAGIDLRITERDWRTLRKHCASSFRTGHQPETGAIGLLGEVVAGPTRAFLVTKIVLPEADDIKAANYGALVFSSTYLRRLHLEMRADGLAGLVTFHTHPMADQQVGFSPFDDVQDPQLVGNLREIEPTTKLISVVLGRRSQAGRCWYGGDQVAQLRQLLVVGEVLESLQLNGTPAPPPPAPAAVFDRALAITGYGALSRLAAMTVAVVGASGTGSLIVELLARAGCQHIILIDDDRVKEVNLNRILYATQSDADARLAKVEVVRRAIERLGLGCRVEAIDGTILDQRIAARLRQAHLLIGCVDRAYPRKLLAQMAYQYLLPFVDVGSEIGGDETGIVSLNARASYVGPGRWCVMCAGLVTPRQLALETLAHEESERVIRLGYSDDLLLHQPAVMDLNMRAASLGMLIVRHLLQPFLLVPVPVTINENIVTYTTIAVQKARLANSECPICQQNPFAGYGDRGPAIGLDPAAVAAIVGPEVEAAV